jgi:hypothetical protein
MKWKGFGRKRTWRHLKVLFQNSPVGTEKTHENLNQYSRSPGRDLNPGPSEYEAGVLTTRPRHSGFILTGQEYISHLTQGSREPPWQYFWKLKANFLCFNSTYSVMINLYNIFKHKFHWNVHKLLYRCRYYFKICCFNSLCVTTYTWRT